LIDKKQTNGVGNGTFVSFSVIAMLFMVDLLIFLQIVFLVLSFTGVILPLFLADPYKIIRTDGTMVTPIRHPSWKTEFVSLFVALRTDPWIVLLFPMFFSSNYFYTWRKSNIAVCGRC
jgi:hypothetical protein